MSDFGPPPVAPSGPWLKSAVREQLHTRRALLGVVGALLLVLWALRTANGAAGDGPEEALSAALAGRGLQVNETSVRWPAGPPEPLAHRPVLFCAAEEHGLPDLYYAEVRGSEGGVVLDVAWVTNLTRSSGAAEVGPLLSGDYALYASKIGDRFDAVTVLDLRGEPEQLTAEWPALKRLQNRITNLQETGRWRGFGRHRYTFAPPGERLSAAVRDGRFVVEVDGSRVVLDPRRREPVKGADRVRTQSGHKAMPGDITWVVDTVRNLSFVGPEPIAWLEHRVFGLKDWFERTRYELFGGSEDTEAEVAAELGVTEEEARRRLSLSATDPDSNWPPPSLDPVLEGHGTVRREGRWIPIVDDPFVKAYPNAPPPFYQTFLRVDPERLYVRVYVIAWDPRQLQLRIMTGTREPESATGETGPGMVPREPETLENLVAAFNGGFQATHGEFGMMSNGRVYLPPKPWSATIGVYEDGRVALGSWLPPPEGVREYQVEWAREQIPEGMVEYRQNLTSVVEDGKYNPWARWYWGAAPLNAEDQTYIDRSGICLTEEGFLAYFWGRSMGPEQLGDAMNAARCVRGMHLDMNLRHTGFELYDVRPEDDPHPPLERDVTDDEYEGPVPHAEGYVARARKAVRSMAPMRFPRYLRRDPRDFFYLVRRPTLPGPHLTDGDAPEGKFSTEGLPHAGWPHAFSRAHLGDADGQRTWLVRIDPHRARPAPLAPEEAEQVLAYLSGAAAPPQDADYALYVQERTVGRRYAVGPPPGGATVVVAGQPLERAPQADAALGVDPGGFVLYAERQVDDAVPLAQRLKQAGVERAVALPANVRLAFVVEGQHVAPDAYERPVDPDEALTLVAHPAPASEVLFPDVEPRPYGVWARLQDARVRYEKDTGKPKRFIRLPDGGVKVRDPDDADSAE